MKTETEIKVEIEYKKALIKSEKWNRIFNGVKSVGSFALATAILLAITLPESNFNKVLKQEMSDKESATILIEVLKEKDEQTRNNLINALRDFYPKLDKRFLEIEIEVAIQAKDELQKKLKLEKEKLENCTNESERILIEQNIELIEYEIKNK